MPSIDMTRVQRRARWAYERGRLRLAFFGVVPIILIVMIASLLTHGPISTPSFGLIAVTLSAAMLWYGRDPQKAVLPGVAAGLIPLVFALSSSHLHGCGANGCNTLCLPACSLGGLIAGLFVAWVGNRLKAGMGFWLSSSLLALLTGAMGCTCVGNSGIVGLGLGFSAGMTPALLGRLFDKKSA